MNAGPTGGQARSERTAAPRTSRRDVAAPSNRRGIFATVEYATWRTKEEEG